MESSWAHRSLGSKSNFDASVYNTIRIKDYHRTLKYQGQRVLCQEFTAQEQGMKMVSIEGIWGIHPLSGE
jgi:hypothetical protein